MIKLNRYRLPDLLIKLIYSMCFFIQFLPHLTLAALLYVYPDSTTALNVNYLKYVLALATFLNSFNRLTLTKLPLVFCANEISLGHFLKNGKTQILSLFINVSLRRWFLTTVVFRFLMFYLKFWKDKFIIRSLVLFARILLTGSMDSTRKIHVSQLLRGDNKLMLFI